MSNSKSGMPKSMEDKCKKAIHTAATAAGAAGALPIPMSDTVPITAAQIAMIVSLGKIFGITLSQSAAKSIATVALVQGAGRAIVANILKAVPGGALFGSVISAATAITLTEALGWIVADDFYRMSLGEDPENIAENVMGLKEAFKDAKLHK